MDTIFAEATPPGRGGVSVVRISGPDARRVAEDLAGPLGSARYAGLRALKDQGEVIDRALVLWFEQNQSFTGEEVVEFHLHGAPVIGSRISGALLARGLRRAEAGEFTRRAFVNGKMDLAAAEGLADLLAAETEAQRKLAMKAADGELGKLAEDLRKKLIRAGALIEASIDFADEEVPDEVPDEVFSLMGDVRKVLEGLLKTYPAAERLREGYEVAIIGPPNAGKSSLLNRIAQREVALVTDVAGTTRDILELRVDLRGLPVTFLDTAGLRESAEYVEALGIERARKRAEKADLRIHLSEDGQRQAPFSEGDLVIRSKDDLTGIGGEFGISSLTGKGIAELLDRIYDLLKVRAVDSALISRKRQAEAVRRAVTALDISDVPSEILAEAVRRAGQELASMTGRFGAEDYLDEIFSSFCIGK